MVREFAIGFGPPLLRWQRGETHYSLRMIPFGGYNAMAGETPEELPIKPGASVAIRKETADDGKESVVAIRTLQAEDSVPQGWVVGTVESADLLDNLQITLRDAQGQRERYPVSRSCELIDQRERMQIAPRDRLFWGKPIWVRAVTVVAGPLMNFLLAALLLAVFSGIQGTTTIPQVEKVLPNSAAQQAGLQPGDRILAIDAQPVHRLEDVSRLVQGKANTPVSIRIERANGRQLNLQAVPRMDPKTGRAMLGVTTSYLYSGHNPILALWQGVRQTGEMIAGTVVGLVQLIQGTAPGGVSANLSGPVGIFSIVGSASHEGLAGISPALSLLLLSALINVSVGLLNLVPFPALDGSQFLFLAAELVRGKPVPPERQGMVQFIGFAILMAFMVVVTYSDVLKLVQ